MRSATTAESSDSIAPSIATVNAGRKRVGIRPGRNCGIATCGSPDGMPPNRLPTVSTPPPRISTAAVPPTSATIAPGTRGRKRRSRIISESAVAPKADCRRRRTSPRHGPGPTCRAVNSDGTAVEPQSEEVADLRARDQHGDAVGEPDHHRARQVLHRRAHAGAPRTTSTTPAIIVHHVEPVDAVGRDDAGDHHDEGAGRPADLVFRPAEGGNQEAGDDRAVDALLGLEPGRDREGHGQRQRHQADRHARRPGRGRTPPTSTRAAPVPGPASSVSESSVSRTVSRPA